jgi:hypothetical protein
MKALKKFFLTAPIIFPLLGVFLLGLTVYEISLFWNGIQSNALFYYRPLIYIIYTIMWIGICYFKKWGAIGFVLTTIAVISTYYFAVDPGTKSILGEILFKPLPLNILMSMLVLFFYKKYN